MPPKLFAAMGFGGWSTQEAVVAASQNALPSLRCMSIFCRRRIRIHAFQRVLGMSPKYAKNGCVTEFPRQRSERYRFWLLFRDKQRS